MNNNASQRQASPAGRRRGSEVVQDPEDWSTATDGKEKKRIQNRVAQRAYRHRLKKRLEDLELQVHEQNSSDSTNHTRNVDEDALHSSKRGHKKSKSKASTNELLEQQTVPHIFSDRRNSYTSSRESLHRPDLNLGMLPRFSPTVSPINPAVNSRAQQQQRQTSVSQSFSQELDNSSGAFNMAQELSPPTFISATMQQELITPYLGQYQQDPSDNFLPQWSLDKDLNFLMLDETPPAAPILDSKPAGLEPMQLETNNSSGNSESPAQSSSSSASKKQSLNSTPSCSVPSTLSVGEDNDNRLQPPNSNASIEGRIEYVLSCAQQAGFDSLDSLVTAYYVREFRQSSTLSVEQRMSRHRRLPQLLAELRQGSTNWSAWERNGYEDEILRAAEDVCGAEYSQFIRRDNSAVEESVIGDLQANGGLPMPQGSFQDNLPRLWALLTSLTSANTSMGHRDRSNVVLASMLLPCYWGRARPDQIISWLQTCLEDSSLGSNNVT